MSNKTNKIIHVPDNVFTNTKDLFSNLINELSSKYHYSDVSVLVEKSTGKNYRISKSGTLVKDNMFASTGAVLRLNSSNGLYEYSFNNFSEEFIKSIPAIITANLENSSNTMAHDLVIHDSVAHDSVGSISGTASVNDYSALSGNSAKDTISHKKICFNKSTSYKINPSELSDEEIINLLYQIHQKGMDYNEKIIDCVCVFQYLTIHKMYLSENKDMQQHLMWSTGVIQPLSSNGEKTHYYHKPFSILGGAEILEEMKSDISDACKKAIDLLNSTVPPAGTYDVICMPDVTGLIAHEAFGHGVEMDMFVKDRALAKNYIGTLIASPLVTMHDNAASCSQAATYFFDDEGTLSNDTVIIEKGILKSGINDLLSAKALGVAPTGNGRRESYERKAYTRMTNTYFEAGTSTLEEMIASVDYGILLDNGSSGMEDPKNWGIQCMVNIGYEIKDGKLTGRIFSPVCLSGYVPDLLKSISMISTELKLSGSGYCGKGYKEWVKVSDGGAAIKTRVTIS